MATDTEFLFEQLYISALTGVSGHHAMTEEAVAMRAEKIALQALNLLRPQTATRDAVTRPDRRTLPATTGVTRVVPMSGNNAGAALAGQKVEGQNG